MKMRKYLFNFLEVANQADFLMTGKTILSIRALINRFLYFYKEPNLDVWSPPRHLRISTSVVPKTKVEAKL